MASIKVVLRKNKLTNKKTKEVYFTYHLALRIIKGRKTSMMFLGHSLDSEKQWDAKSQTVLRSHPNSKWLNNLILTKRNEAMDKLLSLEVVKEDYSSSAIVEKLKPAQGQTFKSRAEFYIEKFEAAEKYNRVTSDRPRINHFLEFLKGKDITFPEITVDLLNRFISWLKVNRAVKDKDGNEKPISERTIVNHLIVIRTIYNDAITAGIATRETYPFGKGGISIKFPESNKIGLNAEEGKQLEILAAQLAGVENLTLGRATKPSAIDKAEENSLSDKLETLDLTARPYLKHAVNVWLYSFYNAGMRVSDVLRSKWSDYQNGRNYYAMGKNNKAGSLSVHEKVYSIISQYRDHEQKHDLIFPELKVLDNLNSKYDVQRKIAYANKRLNKALAEISAELGLSKKLTMHIARHTFGNIAGDKIPIQMLQKLYRHSSITTTIGYQANFIHKDADEALNSVINF